MVTGLGEAPLLSMRLLGGFQVERAGAALAVSGWQRRSAKTLTKLMATSPGHTLHREQILDILWPDADVESALNSFGKALHAARHAFEPWLPRRMDSAYLVLKDAVLSLNTEHVTIDADRFEQLAGNALRTHDVAAYESALGAYAGELLPEDRYADWCSGRRHSLKELRVRVLLGLASAFEDHGAWNEAADRLRDALAQDPARELAHRRLMRLYAEMGTPDQAVRQFRSCQDVLHRELDLTPQPETVALYHDIVARRVPQQGLPVVRDDPAAGPLRAVCGVRPGSGPGPGNDQRPERGPGPPPAQAPAGRPFVGRERLIQQLCGQLAGGPHRQARLVLVTGEAGIGKTRLLEELAATAGQLGAAVLSSGRGAHARPFACGLFAVALEHHAASLPEADRHEIALRYPALARFVPSLQAWGESVVPSSGAGDYHLDLMPAVVRLLADLGRRQPVLLVLGDLRDADPLSLDLLRYLAHLAACRPWLLVASAREEDVEAGSELGRMIEAMIRERLCLGIGLRGLSRRDCDTLVRALHPGAGHDDLLRQIYARSGGNPLFAEELAREIRERRSDAPGATGPRATALAAALVPVRVRALAAARLATMDETVRQVLGLAAASAATEISLGELRTGGAALEPPVSGPALLDALDRALQLRVLEERSSGFAFRQPLFRSALYESLSRHRRDQIRAALPAPGRRLAPRLTSSPVAAG
ncbi:MAG TPA: BTAD domain-containing putative transcriptional regulator [Streptosporangiaceae bacterium]|jgi:DNA-binding SARP family transcriptional activator